MKTSKVVVERAYLDFHGTIAMPSRNRSMDDLFADLVFQHSGVRVNPMRLGAKMRRIRKTRFNNVLVGDEDWAKANAMAVRGCGKKITEAQGARVRMEFMHNDRLWVISSRRRQLLHVFIDLGPGVTCIASNGRRDSIRNILDRYGLLIDIPVEKIYTPGVLGGWNKPSPCFYREMAKREGVPISRSLSCGNSPRTDLGGLEVDMRAMLIPRRCDRPSRKHRLLHTFPNVISAIRWARDRVRRYERK